MKHFGVHRGNLLANNRKVPLNTVILPPISPPLPENGSQLIGRVLVITYLYVVLYYLNALEMLAAYFFISLSSYRDSKCKKSIFYHYQIWKISNLFLG